MAALQLMLLSVGLSKRGPAITTRLAATLLASQCPVNMMLGLEADRNVSEESFVKERQRDAELGDSIMVRQRFFPQSESQLL